MNEATDYSNSIAMKENVDALAKIKARARPTIHELTPAQRQVWIDTLRPIYKTVEPRVGKEIIEMLLKEAGFKG